MIKLASKNIVLIVLMLISLMARAENLRVGIVVSEDTSSFQDFVQALVKQLDHEKIPFSLVQSSPILPDADLIVAVGVKSVTLALNSQIPVLGVMISRSSFEKIQQELAKPRRPGSLSVIYFDQPMYRQVKLIKSLLPGKKALGVLYAQPTSELRQLQLEQTKLRFDLNEQKVSEQNPLPVALHELLETSEVLLALPDVGIFNGATIRNILMAAYHRNVPLIGFSKGYIGAGALSAIYSTPEQLAKQAVSVISKFTGTVVLPDPQYPDEFEVAINFQVARSLGIQVKQTAEIEKLIKANSTAGGGG